MRIRTAIFGVYVFAAAIGFAALMFFILREVRPRYLTSIHGTMQDAAQLLAAAVSEEWGEMPASVRPERLQRMVAAATANQSGLRVQVKDAEGRLLAGAAAETGGDYADGLTKRMASRLLDERAPMGDIAELQAEAEVRSGGVVVARIVLARPVRTLNSFIWSERKKLAAGGLAIAAVMVVAGWWIATQLTRSVERLTGYVEAVRDGRAAELPTTRAREVATLGRAFDEMRTALEGKQHVERTTQALAHGIKAPLAAVRGAAELLREDLPAADRERFLENLRVESARIERIVERLLRLSALEARRSPLVAEVFRARSWLDEIRGAFHAAAVAAGVELRVEADEVLVVGERALADEALGNLVQNAIEFSPRGGCVALAARPAGGRVEIVVTDDGPGVPDYALPRVFERFYSLERPGTGRKSTGLGLALVREIAHLHGGEVRLENRSGGGARAVLTLPGA